MGLQMFYTSASILHAACFFAGLRKIGAKELAFEVQDLHHLDVGVSSYSIAVQ
jgi:hypothetical protein